MNQLIRAARAQAQKQSSLPFSIVSSMREQHIINVPVVEPLLICILSGFKRIGHRGEINCPSGNFIFLSNSSTTTMRNIPNDREYFALLIEFEYEDFDGLPNQNVDTEHYIQGEIDPLLTSALAQFVGFSTYAPREIWPSRRQELLRLLVHLGYPRVGSLIRAPSLTHRLYRIVQDQITSELTAQRLSELLAMSESTLRRKLNAEGTNLQTIKDSVKLGQGLHLIQTTFDPISLIAEQCGYHSQSRFSEKFRRLFGITPTELRKTRVRD